MAAAEYYHPTPPLRPANTSVGGPQTQPGPSVLGSAPIPPYRASSHLSPNVQPQFQQHQPHVNSHLRPPSPLSLHSNITPPPYESPSPRPRPQRMEKTDYSLPQEQPALRRGSSHPIQPQMQSQRQQHVSFADPAGNPYTPPQYLTPQPQPPHNAQYFPPPPPPQQQQLRRSSYQPPPSYPSHSQQLQPYPQPPNGLSPQFGPQQGHYAGPLQQYPPPYAMKPAQGSTTDLGSERGGYSSDPETRHSSHRRRHRTHSDSKRNHTATSLFGGAAGGLIGDMIFPGLGTVGGALAGYIGGRDWSKHQERKDRQRHEEQRRWERKFSKGEYDH